MKKSILLAIVFMMMVSLLAACGGNESEVKKDEVSGKITINGSSAMLPLVQQAKKDFEAKYPKARISASGSASIVGPQSIANGTADIGTCDWDASIDKPGYAKFDGQVGNKVWAIPFATVVNKANPVSNLTQEQLVKIYQGSIKNWKEVGGNDEPIIVINRSFGSGTRVNYQEKALGGADMMKTGDNYKEVGKSGEMVTNINSTKNAIGYVDLVYVKDNIKAVSFNGVEPTVDNVINGTYPIWGYAYMMTKGQPEGVVKKFIEHVQSDAFQNGPVKDKNFIALSQLKK